MIDYEKVSKEELIDEFRELSKAYEALKEYYERDIILLNNAEKQIIKSEEKFRKAFITSPDSVNINRLSDGLYVSINEGFTKLLGYSEEETLGRTSTEMNIWNDPDNRKMMVSQLLENGKIENFETAFRHKDGSIVFGSMSASIMDIEGIPHILNVTRDITERKKIEKDLAREQFLVSAIMDNVSDHIYFKDLKSRFLRVNRAHALRFGIKDPSEVIGKTDFDFFTSEHAQQAFDDEQEIIKTGQLISKIEKETNPDGPDTWVSTVKVPLRDKNNEVIGTFGISRDVTHQKTSEEQFLLLAYALKSINECVSITDMNDKVMFLNEAFLKTYGFSDQDLSESSISQIRSPNNPPEVVREILPATLRGGWNGELLNRKKDGSEFLVSLSTAVVKDISEQPLALIGVANDITERRRMELENLVIYEITRGIAASSNLDELLSLIHDALSKVVYAENCFVALYNKEAESFSFPYFVDRFDTTPPSATLDKSCTAYVFRTVRPLLLTQEKFDNLVQQNEVELIGSNAPSWIGVPLRTPAETIGVLVLQHYEKDNVYSEKDVNFLTSVGSQVAIAIDRKKAEEEIRIKNEQLQSSNAEKDKFFSIIAHDLRGPLSAFVETTRIITEDIQSMTLDDIRSISMSMEKDAANVYALLENLLEWSRLQRGMMDFSPKKIKLNDIISAGVSVVAGSVKTKDIKLDVKIPDNIVVIADKDMIETIVRNLVSNAVKFTPAGGRITIYAVVNPGNVAEIRITDTGIGMSPELKDKLFRMNEKTSRPGTAGELSSGLGLLLCKEFVEKHKGRIWVESKEGQGSTFFFTLVIVT